MSAWMGRSESTVNAVWRLLLRLALVGALLYAGYHLRAIIVTLFAAAIIAYTLDPMVEWLTRQNWFINGHTTLSRVAAAMGLVWRRTVLRRYTSPPRLVRMKKHALRTYATLYVFVLAVIVLWQGAVLTVTPFVHQFQQMMQPQKQEEWRKNFERQKQAYDAKAPDWAKSEKLQEAFAKSDIPKAAQRVGGTVVQQGLSSLKNVVEIVLLPVLAFYFLIDGHKLKHEFAALIPRIRRRETLRIVNEFNRIMRAFVLGQFILCLLAGVVVGLGLYWLHVDYPLMLGVLAGVTRAIPIVGPIIGGIPIILLTYLSQGPGVAVAVLGFFTFLHFAESKFIMPLLIGDRMELHPVVIIVVLVVGGEIGGILMGRPIGSLLGMFFGAPVASIARVIIRRYWLHMRHNPPPHPHTLNPEEAPSSRKLPAGAARMAE